MKSIEIKWRKKTSTVVSQIYSAGLEFCFISDKNQQCNRMVFCKDFLHDCVWARVNNLATEIYEFKYDPTKKPLVDLKRTRIAIGNSSDKKFFSRIPKMLDFINYFDKKLKLRPSSILQCSNPPDRYKSGLFVVEGSNKWLIAPPLLSFYTLMIRIGLGHATEKPLDTLKGILNETIEPYNTEDASTLHQSQEGINNLLANGRTKLFGNKIKNNYKKNIDIDSLHEYYGIAGFAQGETEWELGEKTYKYI